MEMRINPVSSIKGTIIVPGDKSISHRSIMLGSLSSGITTIEGFLNGEDCLSTIKVFRQLGIAIQRIGETSYQIEGKGLTGLREPDQVLDVGNSGTTIRLTAGILAGQNFHSVITGDESIIRRPMKRVTDPLKAMGAIIDGKDQGRLAPLSIRGGSLKGITYHSPVASAQVKSALLFAGLFADQQTVITEPSLSRDHSEKMLKQFGANLQIMNQQVTIWPNPKLESQHLQIPADFSSAAFFIAAAILVPNSELRIKNVGVNPTRIGFLEAVKRMKGNIELENLRYYGEEPVADIVVQSSQLEAITLNGDWIPKLIDELPLFAVLASQAEGITRVEDAEELRVKETDRIYTIISEMNKVGVVMEELKDGFVVQGKQPILGGKVDTHFDHRIGMAMAIAGLIAKESILVENWEAINISFPSFVNILDEVIK